MLAAVAGNMLLLASYNSFTSPKLSVYVYIVHAGIINVITWAFPTMTSQNVCFQNSKNQNRKT